MFQELSSNYVFQELPPIMFQKHPSNNVFQELPSNNVSRTPLQ